MSTSPRQRLDAGTRRSLLLQSAREVFAEVGYASSGLAEVAERAGVSKTLVYHYFPDGRPQLYRAVLDDLISALVGQLRTALRAPVSAERRVALLVERLFDFFDGQPDAFRLLFLEPWGSGDPGIVGQALAIRVRLGAELTSLLSAAGVGTTETMAAAAASTGSLLHVCELWLSGQVDRERAVEVASTYVRGGLDANGLL